MLPQAGYGQGQVVVSPLKMARIAGAVATRGVIIPVSWVKAPEPTTAYSHSSRRTRGPLEERPSAD